MGSGIIRREVRWKRGMRRGGGEEILGKRGKDK
jgi:hypothetical protein